MRYDLAGQMSPALKELVGGNDLLINLTKAGEIDVLQSLGAKEAYKVYSQTLKGASEAEPIPFLLSDNDICEVINDAFENVFNDASFISLDQKISEDNLDILGYPRKPRDDYVMQWADYHPYEDLYLDLKITIPFELQGRLYVPYGDNGLVNIFKLKNQLETIMSEAWDDRYGSNIIYKKASEIKEKVDDRIAVFRTDGIFDRNSEEGKYHTLMQTDGDQKASTQDFFLTSAPQSVFFANSTKSLATKICDALYQEIITKITPYFKGGAYEKREITSNSTCADIIWNIRNSDYIQKVKSARDFSYPLAEKAAKKIASAMTPNLAHEFDLWVIEQFENVLSKNSYPKLSEDIVNGKDALSYFPLLRDSPNPYFVIGSITKIFPQKIFFITKGTPND